MQCPVCRADNSEGPSCRRCRADLSLLWAIDDRRRHCLDAARRLLGQGHGEPALAQIEQAAALRQGADADQLAALAHLLSGNFGEAWRFYHQVRPVTPRIIVDEEE
jgi:hypothetical protein